MSDLSQLKNNVLALISHPSVQAATAAVPTATKALNDASSIVASIPEVLPIVAKPALASSTIWGGIAAVAGVALPPLLSKIGVTPSDAAAGSQLLGSLVSAAGGLLAIWGRSKATTIISGLFKTKS